jgi:SpoVK/Ycf46/Vps4 family AAA+-type ATPase
MYWALWEGGHVIRPVDQLAGTYPNLLFIATSNFTGAIDEAFLSRADLIVTVDLPAAEACEKILFSTVAALAEVHPKLAKLRDDHKLKQVAAKCVGLDGRRIRKVVVSALTLERELALDPSRLTINHLVRAIEHAHAELKSGGRQ